MDRSWILDEEWGCLQRNLRGKERIFFFSPSTEKGKEDARSQARVGGGGGREVLLPYMGYIGMCRCELNDFQAVYSGIGYINQRVWV